MFQLASPHAKSCCFAQAALVGISTYLGGWEMRNSVWPAIDGAGWTLAEWLLLFERELLLFALFWLLIGMVDELAVDALWFGLRMNRENRTRQVSRDAGGDRLHGRIAIFIACWQEAEVIGTTISQMLATWREPNYVLYVGCYGNDPATVAAVADAVEHDPRLRVVIHDRYGPTTKADCLNRIYAALCVDEQQQGERFHGIILHDSEDMVHALELSLVDRALLEVDFVQLPVRPEIPEGRHWVAGHYADEFAEAHARLLVVRDALGAGLPAAGVSCGFSREMLARIGQMRGREGDNGPFAAECFTEDYELGLLITRLGGRSRFLRCRDADGQLIGTRSYFPNRLGPAVRQKTRWMHGISLQGWDRMGWAGGGVERWMALRDRRGPLIALVLFAAYLLIAVEGALALARWHYGAAMPVMTAQSVWLRYALMACAAGSVWRMAMRFMFTTREYGWWEGCMAVLRLPLGNIVMIMAGRRAMMAYCRSLAGGRVVWDKTEHKAHPALARLKAVARQKVAE